MFRPDRPIRTYLLWLFAALLLVIGIPQYSNAQKIGSFLGSNVPDLLDLSRKKASCCNAAEKDPTAFTPFASPEYETYRLTATYYSLRGGLTTTLMLNNKGAQPILAMPTFYSMAGTRLRLAPITVAAASYLDVDMHQLLAGAGDEFQEGSFRVAYEGISQQLGAQVKMVDAANKLIWAEQLVYGTKFVSSRLETVWWLPFGQTETRVAVSNTSNGTVTVTIEVEGTAPLQSAPVNITLAPWETRVLDIMGDLVGNGNGIVKSKGGISITHTGAPGAVLARMFISKPTKGYSAANSFIDPGTTASQRWHGNGLRFRNLDGTKLNPVLTVRNTGDQLSRVRGRIIYTLPDDSTGTIDLPQQPVAAGATRIIDLAAFIETADVPSAVTYGGIELDYDTPNGTVITSVQSISQNGDHVFQVPMFDPDKIPSSAGGFPWKADGDFTTVVYIKNETDTPKKYIAHLLHPGGQYSTDEQIIKPNQTIAINFRELRESQKPDGMGRVIPLEADNGQIAWSVRGAENKVLSGRSEQISLSEGVASTYSCANCCPDSFYDANIVPDWIELDFGSSGLMAPMQTDITCNQTLLGPYMIGSANWDSDNVNVVTVSGGSLFTQGVGTATIFATWETCLYSYPDCTPTCDETMKNSSVAVVPVVQIADFQVVQKGSSRNIFVGVSPTNNTHQITLKITKTSGTGSATFDNDTASKVITQSGTVEIKGVTESSAKDNFILEATIPTSNGTNTIASKTFSVAKVKISGTIGSGSSSEISATKNTIVGERIILEAEMVPSGLSISGHSWTLPGNVMKEFVVTSTSGSVAPVSPLNTANVDFVWYDGGDNREVEYQGTVNGYALSGKAIFNVARPTATITATSTAQTAVDSATGVYEIHLGVPGSNPGIAFTRTINSPSPYSSFSTQWVQLVDSFNFSSTDRSTGNPIQFTGITGLDEQYPYSTSNPTDSPGVIVANFKTSMSHNVTWSMYLMYKPSVGQDQNVFVPLRKITWSWVFTATESNGVWLATATSEPRNQNLTDAEASNLQWTSVIP